MAAAAEVKANQENKEVGLTSCDLKPEAKLRAKVQLFIVHKICNCYFFMTMVKIPDFLTW